MKYFFITGETSGDYIASVVAKDILQKDQDAQIQAWGGDAMRSVGCDIKYDISGLRLMGFLEVLKKLPNLLKLISQAKTDIEAFHPDIIIFVDFAGFNLRIAKWAKSRGYKTVYIAPPKTWASRENRNVKLQKYIDKVIVLFPFEKEYFNSKGIDALYCGHPLQFKMAGLKQHGSVQSKYQLDNKPIALLAPGSRTQEIKAILPIISELAKPFPQFNWVVSCAPNISIEYLNKYIPKSLRPDISIVKEPIEILLQDASYAIITSGTATYQAALLKVPQIVVYRTGHVNYWLAKRLIKAKYISLINLIMDEEVVTELIQYNLHICNLKDEMRRLMDSEHNSELIEKYNQLHQKIKSSKNFNHVAQTILQLAAKLE